MTTARLVSLMIWLFFSRDSIYAIARICHAISVCLSVCLSHACIVSKRLNISSEILSPSDRPIILVFQHQGSLRKSDDFTTSGGAKYKMGSDFRPICGYISETVRDRGIVNMEDEYKVICALSNGAVFDDLEWPKTLRQLGFLVRPRNGSPNATNVALVVLVVALSSRSL